MPVNSFDDYPMNWKPSLADMKPPLYKALAQKLEEDIKSGHLHPGDLLPPQRELADFLDLNLSTITKAFKLCSQKGLITSSIGKGTFVAADAQVDSTLLAPSKAVGLIEMGAIHPAYEFNSAIQSLIVSLLASSVSQVGTNNQDSQSLAPHFQYAKLLEYNIPTGTPSQKHIGALWLQKAGLHVSEEQILLANGGQNALFTIFASLFQAGDRIGADPLVFAGAKTAAKMLGIQLIAIPSINDEMSAELLEQYCKTEGLKGIYTTSLMVSPLNAEIACALIQSPLCQEILSQRRLMTIERNKWVNSILDGYNVLGDLNCNFRLLLLPESWSGRSFELCAKNAGVQVYCGERFAIGTGNVTPCVRLSITTPRSIEELKRGLYILKEILDTNIQEDFTLL